MQRRSGARSAHHDPRKGSRGALRAFGQSPNGSRTRGSRKRGRKQELTTVDQLEPQLRNTIISSFTTAFANASVPFLDMAANQALLAKQIAGEVQPAFEALGLRLETLTVENLSLPDELQKRLDERISMNMIGDMRQYTQFQAAQSIPIAAANEGGIAGLGAGLGAGMGIGGAMADAMRGSMGGGGGSAGAGAAAGAAAGGARSKARRSSSQLRHDAPAALSLLGVRHRRSSARHAA